MGAVFLKIVNMSITASWLILAVILVRLFLKKAPKWISCVLWALVAIRLICPFSFESTLSLIPSAEVYPIEIIYSNDPQIANNPYNWKINTGISALDGGGNNTLLQNVSTGPVLRSNLNIIGFIWLVGIAALLLHAFISYAKLKRTVGASVPVRDNILACDEVKSPFILGIIKPLIYVPSSMTGATLDYVITHESAHIQRRDHWWKPFGYLLLTVYWFNPLCWLAYVLLCRDIEMACDEKVVREFDNSGKAAYSQALLDCSFPRRKIAACPLAFGEVGVKERVKSVLNYKKPAFWIIVVAVVACIVVGVCFLTDPKDNEPDLSFLNYENACSLVADVTDVDTIYYPPTKKNEDGKISIGYVRGNDLAKYLDTVSWQKRKASQEGLSSPGSIEFCIRDDYRITVYQKPRLAMVTYGDDVRYYKTHGGDYDDAVKLFYYGVKEIDVSQWDERPMLVMDGEKYMDPYKPESTLPHGYSLAGTLTEEQAYNTGLEGTQYFTNPNEPDIFYTYQLCATPTSIDEVDSENRNWQYLRWISVDADTLKERRLTLDDVRWLAMKGETLSWDDFDAYQGTDIGSGLYIMQYVIDDLFDVLVGGGSLEADPEYVHLRNRDINAWVDIRTDDIDEFIEACSSNVTGVDGESVTANIRTDVCELYLEVLEDLWNVDPGLNSGISQIGIDLSNLSHLTELEKETVMHEFASKHDLPYIAGTWEELCEQGYIDKDNLFWEDGLFFSIKTNEDAVWNLPAIKEGDSVPELTSFDAQKWRSGLGVYFFGQCTARKNADGTWSYTVGQEAIS